LASTYALLDEGQNNSFNVMKTTKIMAVTVGIAILAILAAVIAVQARTPQVKDASFDPDTDKLRLLPANLVVVRATHFPAGTPKVRRIQDHDGEILTRTLGRNVSLQDVIAEGWDCNPARVVLPPRCAERRL
jgi:hypothetical protein